MYTMGRKKQKGIEKKIQQEIKRGTTARIDPKIEKFKLYGLFCVVIFVFIGLSLWKINAPFVHVSEDTNGTNGIGAANLSRLGFFNLKFGLYNRWISNLSGQDLYGKFYAHHPIGFLIPTAIFYKLFGINEITTRLGPLFLSLIALILLFFAIYKIAENSSINSNKASLLAFLCSLTFAILPGAIYYGKHLDMSPPSLAFMLISFSLFIFYYHEAEQSKKKRLWFYLFLISIFLGGLIAWHYYFMPVSILIFILFTKQGKLTLNKNKLLFFIPIILIAAFSINLFHVYLLNGKDGLDSLKASYLQRSARQISAGWFKRIFDMSKLNFTLLFIITAILGFIMFLFKIFKDKSLLFFLPIVLTPLFILLIFQQWSTHPFGMIYFLPFVGIFSGILFYELIKNLDVFGIVLVCLIFIFGVNLSYKNLDFFYNKFLILGQKDPALLKEFRTQIKNNEVCVGRNNFGIDLAGITNWYVQKETIESPNCFATSTPNIAGNLKYGLVFKPNLGDFYKNEVILFEQNNFRNLIKCSEAWCLISK